VHFSQRLRRRGLGPIVAAAGDSNGVVLNTLVQTAAPSASKKTFPKVPKTLNLKTMDTRCTFIFLFCRFFLAHNGRPKTPPKVFPRLQQAVMQIKVC